MHYRTDRFSFLQKQMLEIGFLLILLRLYSKLTQVDSMIDVIDDHSHDYKHDSAKKPPAAVAIRHRVFRSVSRRG